MTTHIYINPTWTPAVLVYNETLEYTDDAWVDSDVELIISNNEIYLAWIVNEETGLIEAYADPLKVSLCPRDVTLLLLGLLPTTLIQNLCNQAFPVAGADNENTA